MQRVNVKTGEVIFASDPGCKDFTPIDWKYDENAKMFVPVLGKKLDIYSMIQLHKDSTDLSNIIARVKAGDVSALNVAPGQYMDVSEAPKSLNELAAFNARIDKSWEDLDPKVKEIFGNDLSKFTQALINNELSKTINEYMTKNSKVEPQVEPNVENVEVNK